MTKKDYREKSEPEEVKAYDTSTTTAYMTDSERTRVFSENCKRTKTELSQKTKQDGKNTWI